MHSNNSLRYFDIINCRLVTETKSRTWNLNSKAESKQGKCINGKRLKTL